MAGLKTLIAVVAGAIGFGLLEHKVFSKIMLGESTVIEPTTNTTVGDLVTYTLCAIIVFAPLKIPRFIRLMAVGGIAFEVGEAVVWILREH